MDDNPEAVLQSICCTCLSVDRKLTQLCRVDDGVNNLFFYSHTTLMLIRMCKVNILLLWDKVCFCSKIPEIRLHLPLHKWTPISNIVSTHMDFILKKWRLKMSNQFLKYLFDEAMFEKAATHLFICWECRALMSRLCKFRDQACFAQKQLTVITDGRLDTKHNTLSKLSYYHQDSYNKTVTFNDFDNNFIDCGPELNDIKTEYELNDTSLLEEPILDLNEDKINTTDDTEINLHQTIEVKASVKRENTGKKERLIKKRKKLLSKEVDSSDENVNYSTIEMSEQEMIESRESRKRLESFESAVVKCESCIECFKDYNELEKHNLELHVQKPRYIQCDICLVYIKYWWLPEHRKDHYTMFKCNFCEHLTLNMLDILKHLKFVHGTINVRSRIWQKVKRRAEQTNPALNSRRTKQPDIKTPFGYLCYECNKYFENKYLRYKHILKFHREGFKCKTCGKIFAFKNTLNKHEQIHAQPLPREKCEICDKMVRVDRVKTHARIHSDRKPFDCVACDKRFVSLESYEKHLKNSRVHAVHDVHKYKCTMCEKGFRTVTELNDHINYIHMERTHHKCPICNKALATRRGVTRHVRRAHQGLKEKIGDKILCQTCGKAFRDKKCLQEHELIHTGEKPLSCDICGRTFRQSACLYTHKRRVHKMAPKRQIIHTDDINIINIKV